MTAAAGLAKLAARSGLVGVALADGGAEVTARQFPAWERNRGTLESTVTFGPYPEPVTASQLVVVVDDEPEQLNLKGALALPAGVAFKVRFTVRIG